MMKKLTALLLAAAMVFSLSATALAVPRHMSNFKKDPKAVTAFQDVKKGSWYAEAVKNAVSYRLMQGVSKKQFRPAGTLTVAEALTLAVRVHSIYTTGKPLAPGKSSPWYQPYVDYALKNKLLEPGDFSDYNRTVTRAETAYLFANALPPAELHGINDIEAVPDMEMGKYYYSVLLLYNAGVLTGTGPEALFLPDATLTRAEAASIVSRMAVPKQRKKFIPLPRHELGDILPGLVVYLPGEREAVDGSFSARIHSKNGQYRCELVSGAPAELKAVLASRGYQLTAGPVKKTALRFGKLPVTQYEFRAADEAGKERLGFAQVFSENGNSYALLYLTLRDSTEFRAVLAAPTLHGAALTAR